MIYFFASHLVSDYQSAAFTGTGTCPARQHAPSNDGCSAVKCGSGGSDDEADDEDGEDELALVAAAACASD